MTADMPPSETAVETVALRGRTGAGVNWVGAFLLYAKGATLEEVSDELGIPFQKLRTKYREEDWDSLVKLNRLAIAAPSAAVAPMGEIVIRDAAKRIEANREASLSVSQGLRAHIQAILDAYKEGKQFLPPGDIKILAAAAKDLDAASMTALGDDPAPKFQPPPPDPNPKPQDNRPITHFHINLPAAAMAPRVPRQVGEVHHTLPAVPVKGAMKNPILDPRPAEPAVVMRPQRVESEVVEGRGGLNSVDFTKLAKVVKAVPAAPKGGVPDCFR